MYGLTFNPKYMTMDEQYTLWCTIIGKTVPIKEKFSSPFREDSDPSCVLLITRYNNIIMKDFGGSGEIYTLRKALSHFHPLELETNIKTKIVKLEESTKKLHSIQIKSQKFNDVDLAFWGQYHISINTLLRYHVKSITHYWLNYTNNRSILITCSTPSYSYEFGCGKRKIYSPNDLKQRWISNLTEKDIFGYKQLPETGEILVITKSLKDIMVYNEVFRISAISPQSENTEFSHIMMEDLAKRFKHIFINYDDDDAGHKYSNLRFQQFQSIIKKEIFVPKHKDLSGFIKNEGLLATQKLKQSMINV